MNPPREAAERAAQQTDAAKASQVAARIASSPATARIPGWFGVDQRQGGPGYGGAGAFC